MLHFSRLQHVGIVILIEFILAKQPIEIRKLDPLPMFGVSSFQMQSCDLTQNASS